MNIYQLKISLKRISPPIWRRVLVPGNVTLSQLHDLIQVCMGWNNAHLFNFEIYEEYYNDESGGLSTRLDKCQFAEKSKLIYTYDFGDDWEHEIIVEKIVSKVPGGSYPVCIAGKRACPPEDYGGVWGYQNLLSIITDENHPEYEETMEWLGEEFHPELFHPDSVNKRLNL